MNNEGQYTVNSKILSGQHDFFGLITRIILVCLYLTPSITLFSGLPKIRLEELVIIFCFFWSGTQSRIRISWGLHQSLHCFFCIFVLASILVGSFLGYESSLGDLNQLIRIFKYVFIYTVALTAINTHPDPDKERISLFEFIVYVSTIVALIGIQQYFDLFGLNKFYVMSLSDHATTLIDYAYPRAIGLAGNPNDFGFMTAVSTLIAYTLVLYKKEEKTLFIFLFFVNFSSALMSVSRGALSSLLIGLVLITFVYIINPSIKTKHSNRQLVITVGLFCLLSFFLFANETMQEQMLWRFFAMQDLSDDVSFQEREVFWKGNISLFQTSPFLGVGPLRRAATVEQIADNEWLLLLRCYGIIGTFFWVLALVIPQLVNLKTNQTSITTRSFNVTTFAILVGTFLFMIPAAVYHSLLLMPVVLIATSITDMSSRIFVLKK
jgi:O-Antigen ligase